MRNDSGPSLPLIFTRRNSKRFGFHVFGNPLNGRHRSLVARIRHAPNVVSSIQTERICERANNRIELRFQVTFARFYLPFSLLFVCVKQIRVSDSVRTEFPPAGAQ